MQAIEILSLSRRTSIHCICLYGVGTKCIPIRRRVCKVGVKKILWEAALEKADKNSTDSEARA